MPSFDGYRAPTEHPLAVAFGALLSLVGERRPRDGRLPRWPPSSSSSPGSTGSARTSFSRSSGSLRPRCCCTRFDFPFLAARGYVDIPYLALVIWAAALEAERPRRGTPVFVLLACAGLLRPEAWLLSGLYWLWCSCPADLARSASGTPR